MKFTRYLLAFAIAMLLLTAAAAQQPPPTPVSAAPLTSTQAFVLQLISMIMPTVAAIVAAISAWIGWRVKQGQKKAEEDREAKAHENRQLTTQLTESIDNAKQEVLAATKNAPFFDGVVAKADEDDKNLALEQAQIDSKKADKE